MGNPSESIEFRNTGNVAFYWWISSYNGLYNIVCGKIKPGGLQYAFWGTPPKPTDKGHLYLRFRAASDDSPSFPPHAPGDGIWIPIKCPDKILFNTTITIVSGQPNPSKASNNGILDQEGVFVNESIDRKEKE